MSSTPDTADREIIISRIVDAPRTKVWRAFTEPEHLIQWWGPNGFTNTFHEFAFKEGGVWRFMMHGPDGTDYPNRIVFDEIVPQEHIAYTHDDDSPEEKGHVFHSTVSFEEQADGKTKVTLHLVCQTAGERDFMVKFGAIEGGKQTLGRLAAHLPTM